MLASVSFKPCFFRRSASSRYPPSARASSALRNRLARSSQESFAAIASAQVLGNRWWSSLISENTKPGILAGLRQSTAVMGGQQPSHHSNAVTGTLGRAYTSKAEIELSRPRAIVRTDVLYSPKTPTDIRIYKDRFRFGPMICTHGNLLSALRANAPRVASERRDPGGQQKGIASDGEFYPSSVLSERTDCPKSPGVRPVPTPPKRTYCEHRTDRVQCCLSIAGAGAASLLAFRFPAIRSTDHECRCSSASSG